MADFKPSMPYSVAIKLYIPTYTTSKGVQYKTYEETDAVQLNCSFKTYGGTERTTNNAFVVEDTAVVETWYRADIKPDCKIKVLATGDEYEIIGKPENINMRNQFIRFKVKAIEGGA